MAAMPWLPVRAQSSAESSKLLSDFDIDDNPICNGTTSVVYQAARRKKGTDEIGSKGMGRCYSADVLAIKVMKATSASTTQEREDILREYAILNAVKSGPWIIDFHGLYRLNVHGGERTCWAFVMEHLSGGDLFDVAMKQAMDEPTAARVIKGLLAGLAHIHDNGVVHRDVRAEGLLLRGGGEGGAPRPVLADFSSACFLSDAREMQRRVGSPGYCAPEVLLGMPYGSNADVFSAGVILYFLLCGARPFTGPDTSATIRRNAKCKVKFTHQRFGAHSPAATAFCSQLLTAKSAERPSASAALSSQWLTQDRFPTTDDCRAPPPPQPDYSGEGGDGIVPGSSSGCCTNGLSP